MVRRLLVLGLVIMVVSTLAAVAAVQSSTDEAEAQVSAYEMSYLCRDYYTGLYKGSFAASCPPGHQLLTLPDDYPVSLCASAYDSYLRAPNAADTCPPGTAIRIDLPAETAVNFCYHYFTGRLSLAQPYPNGTCSGASFLVTFPTGFDGLEDTYQTLGNVDIDVPAPDGLLANDSGMGLTVTAFDATSANGGDVNVNPDGSFTYVPPAPSPNAFIGDDTFTYMVADDGGGSDVVTVTIQVFYPTVWFVDADAPTNGDGRRMTPLNDLTMLNDELADPDETGDFIFLFEATATYPGDFLLEEAQYLVGQEVDLAEILQSALEGTTLQGAPAETLPPFLVTPDTNPTLDVPTLTEPSTATALTMTTESTAVGLTIVSEGGVGVEIEDSTDVTLDRVSVYGGEDFDGAPGVYLFLSSATIVDSEIYGSIGGTSDPGGITGSALQGGGAGGDGGPAIQLSGSQLLVSNSAVAGGNGLGGSVGGGDGGDGIGYDGFAQITVDDGSIVTGGNGGSSSTTGGDGGNGIGADSIPIGIAETSSQLQGTPGPQAPFIDVRGASTVTAGNAGNAGNAPGLGGVGILSPLYPTRLTEGSSATGGDGGSTGSGFAGDGGPGIVTGGTALVGGSGFGSSLQGATPAEPDGITVLNVDSSTVSGGQGGGVETGVSGYGGDGIVAAFLVVATVPGNQQSALQGDMSFVAGIVVNASSVTAGNGGGASAGSGGNGGWGIVGYTEFGELSDGPFLQGPGGPGNFVVDIEVTGSTVIGGVGGTGDDNGGDGGHGIANGIPFFLDPGFIMPQSRSLQLLDPDDLVGGNLTVVNSTVSGSAGGTSTQGGDNLGGTGGFGIIAAGASNGGEISSSALMGNTGGGLTTTISNSVVTGADGATGGFGGSGGDAILTFGMDVVVDQQSTATGGNGADIGSGSSGGNGGFGIYAEGAAVTVDDSTITAGDGGNSGESDAGYGGEGISGFSIELTVQNSALVTGGDSGTGLFEGEGIPGGDGIFVEEGIVTVTDSAVTGGVGSPSGTTNAGSGGHGVHVVACFGCNTLTITNATVTGGLGGFSAGDDAGDGGEGVIVENDNATITGSTITGGDGGSGDNSDGDGAPAVVVFFDQDTDHGIIIVGNTLTAGSGDNGVAEGLLAINDGLGDICVDATANTTNGVLRFDNSAASGTLGITQSDGATLATANGGAAVDLIGTIDFNCVIVQN